MCNDRTCPVLRSWLKTIRRGVVGITEIRMVAGHSNYYVDELGAVYSVAHIGNVRNKPPDICRKLHPTADACGYPCVKIGRSHTMRVSVLVLTSFVGPRPPNMESCHNDGDKTNNALNNLRWDTRKGNAADRITHGTAHNHYSKLSERQTIEIRVLTRLGISGVDLARRFNVSKMTISDIKNGKRRKYLFSGEQV